MFYNRIRILKEKRASILVMFGVGLIALFGFVSLGTDLGIIYKRRAELQQAVDAAAIAGSKKIDEIKNDSIMNGQELTWSDSLSTVVKTAAKESGLKNGITLADSDISLIPSGFPEKVKVKKEEDVELFFAKLIKVNSVKVVVESVAENQYLSRVNYDLLPWGIPRAEAIQTGDVTLQSDDHFTGFSSNSLGTFNFVPGKEYLLKLGSGIADSAYDSNYAGDKIIIPLGSADQSTDDAYKKAYGFAYWCLINGISVDWLINYRGGAFMIDYRGDLFNGTFADVNLSNSSGNGVINGKFGNVNYEIIPKNNVIKTYLKSSNPLYMDKNLKIAVYTVVPDWGANMIPFGIDYRQGLVHGNDYILKFNSSKNQASSTVTNTFDETIWMNEGTVINEADYDIDLDGNGVKTDSVKVEEVTEFPLKTGNSAYFDETHWYSSSDTIDESTVKTDLDGDGDTDDTVIVSNISQCPLSTGGGVVFDETHWYAENDSLSEAGYDVDLNGDGDKTDNVLVPDVTEFPLKTQTVGGTTWDENVSHNGNSYRVSEAVFDIDFNEDGDKTDNVKLKNVSARPITNSGSNYKMDLNDDGDYYDVVNTGSTQYQVDINDDSDWNDSVTMGAVTHQVDLNSDGDWNDSVAVGSLTYKVDINNDGDWDDQVPFTITGTVLPGPGNFAGLAIDGNGANVYRDSIKNGCSTPLSVGDLINTEPGNMAGPTYDGVKYRLDNGLVYVTCPIVNTLDVNGRKEIEITGFAHFILKSTNQSGNGNNAYAEVHGEFVDIDQWNLDSENPNNYVVARTLTEAGVPFGWVHDSDILAGTLSNYNILMTDDDLKFDFRVVAKIADFTKNGGFLYAQDGPAQEIDTKIEVSNSSTGTNYPQITFSSANVNIDPSLANVNTNNPADFLLSNNYSSMSIFELMAIQNHETTITGYTGEVASFNTSALTNDTKVLGSVDSSTSKYVSSPYGIGHAIMLSGHDQGTTAGWRLILNNIFIASQLNVNLLMKPNLGCLDLNGVRNNNDDKEYYVNIGTGYDNPISKGDYVYTIPGNLPSYTNGGVSTRYNSDPGAKIVTGSYYSIDPSGSPRGVIVPIIVPSAFSKEDYYADNQSRNIIYDLKGRSRVKVIGLGLFLLSDINQNSVQRSELSSNPFDTTGKGIYNGQVRGIFVKYIESP